MEESIRILSTPALIGLLTTMLVLITGGYAWTTVRILAANRAAVAAMNDQLEAQARPYVVVSMFARTGTTLLCLRVENVGRSRAEQAAFTMSHDFFVNAEQHRDNLAKVRPFTGEPISLAPGEKLEFVLGVGTTLRAASAAVCPRRFEVQVHYGFGEKRYIEKHPLDWEALARTVVTIDPVADEIQKLRQSVDRIGQTIDGLRLHLVHGSGDRYLDSTDIEPS